MKLTIHPTSQPIHRPVASFIRGGNPADWLQEISRYGLPLTTMDCYVLPQSIRSVEAAGLLVIFKEKAIAKKLTLPDAYGVLADKLYLPVQAQLHPQLSEAELQKLLLWPVQVYHPIIGFVSFEEKDKLDFTRLFTWTLPQKTTWRQAHSGLPARPGLQQILVAQPTPEEIIEQVKEELQTKPLEDIPGGGEAPDTLLGKIAEDVKDTFFTGLSAVLRLMDKLMPQDAGGGGNSGSNGGNGSSAGSLSGGKDGWLQKLTNWVNKNLDDIEKKRQTELQRLMNLFDTDVDEALQYAIPLDSPYLNRGQATPGATLGRRDTSFSLGKLGGGRSVDGWDLGDYYQNLRNKYLASAQAAIAKGDFKKAAYVYAHLLGDYNSAANVLMQGGYYREAAALYKDHLKNSIAAAECLEKGGLLSEATALYLQLARLEKAGDLYRQMEQEEKAIHCYEQEATGLVTNDDHLEAARIINEKMGEPVQARQTLLQGWEYGNKAEACLKKYYDLVAAAEGEDLVQHLKTVYAKAPAADSRFLNVLVHVRERYTGVETASKKIAYAIMSQQAANGITANLHQLKSFLPQDKFITGDTSRYISSQKKPTISKPDEGIKLNSAVEWLDATYYRNQLIAIGILNGHLRLARANWYGNVEYYSWVQSVGSNRQFSFPNKNPLSKTILLRTTGATSFEKKVLPKNRYFTDEIVVESPTWVDNVSYAVAVENGFAVLERTQSPVLHFYNKDGAVTKSVSCRPMYPDTCRFNMSSKIEYWNDWFYAVAEHYMVMVHKEGTILTHSAKNDIEEFAVSKSAAQKWIVALSSDADSHSCDVLYLENELLEHYSDFEVSKGIKMVQFISADVFILISEFRVDRYQIDNEVTWLNEIIADSPIIEAIPVPHQNHFGLVHQNGTVSLHPL